MAGIATRAVLGATDRLADALASDVPDVTVERVGEGLRVTGPGLTLRWLEDVRLRTLVAGVARGLR